MSVSGPMFENLPESLATVLTRMEATTVGKSEKGRSFEDLIRHFLLHDPTWGGRFVRVDPWTEFASLHGIKGQDTGIDLVGEGPDGSLCAVQCKFYPSGASLSMREVSTFITASGKTYPARGGSMDFASRIFASVGCRWSRLAEEALERQKTPCQRLDEQGLATSSVDWEAWWEGRKAPPTQRQVLRPDQEEALAAVLAGFENGKRGKLIMPCGTGKTRVALAVAESLVPSGGRVLVLVPSLSLVSQTLRSWSEQASRRLSVAVVCSDTKVAKRKARDDSVEVRTCDLAVPVTTAAEPLARALRRRLRRRKGEETSPLHVVFSTYHSIAVVGRAQQQHQAPPFDLVVCDEAHRTTGVEGQSKEASPFVQVHSEEHLRARKRLYMTATPRIYTERAKAKAKAEDNELELYSMDDEDVYGPEFYRFSFAKAVEQGLLTDYHILVLSVDETMVARTMQGLLAEEGELSLPEVAKMVGCYHGLAKTRPPGVGGTTEALTGEPMQRAVAFCSTIAASQAFCDRFSQLAESLQGALSLETQHVDGTQHALERSSKVQWLSREGEPGHCRVLSNVRCLSEGVDVPALDAGLFLGPCASQVYLVASVGRVMRTAPAQTFGSIIRPVVVSADAEPEKVLDRNQTYREVWSVLQALRAHDERFDAMINSLDTNPQAVKKRISALDLRSGSTENDENGLGPSLHEQLALQLSQPWCDAVYAKLVKVCGSKRYWETWSEDVGRMTQSVMTRLTEMLAGETATPRCKDVLARFLKSLREVLHTDITQAQAIEMLAQYWITEPVFKTFFGGNVFLHKNPMSCAMREIWGWLSEVEKALATERKTLEPFYRSVKLRVQDVDTAQARQEVLADLYETYFRAAFPQLVARLGIVYTPVECVDFLIKSADWLAREHFSKGLGEEGVDILDPFTGTGTFISRLLQVKTDGPASPYVLEKTHLEHKYLHEIHANECVPLAYWIAALNIEGEYYLGRRKENWEALPLANKTVTVKNLATGETWQEAASYNPFRLDDHYKPFPGILFTDTFSLHENEGSLTEILIEENNERRQRQRKAPIRVILGNPPYSVGQRSTNDNNPNLKYPRLDASIDDTYTRYAKAQGVQNVRSMKDSYVRAIRWATDRIGEEGIVAFITNGSYIDGSTGVGLRKCLLEEFSKV